MGYVKHKRTETMKKTMSKYAAEKLCIELNNGHRTWRQERAQRTPNFTEWRQGIPEECLTDHFMAFAAQTSKSGLELKNAFSIYSKLIIIAPAFINQYIEEGAQIERPAVGEWNLRELVTSHYGISESVYRIIEQEKIPDSRGTTRSGFEALQAIFVKGCRLGSFHEDCDYFNGDLKFENKGEAGRLVGQERLFSADGYKAACERCARKYHTTSFDKGLRKAFHAGHAPEEVIKILRGIYPDASNELYAECATVYMKYLNEIPEVVDKVEYKKKCVRRETKWLNAEYEVREVVTPVELSADLREKEVLRFVAGLMELKLYQQHAHFDVLDLCENKTGRILSYDCREMNITNMAEKMWGKVRFCGSIGNGTRDGAHQIGFYY